MPRFRASSTGLLVAAGLAVGMLTLAFHGTRSDRTRLPVGLVLTDEPLRRALERQDRRVTRLAEGGFRVWTNLAFGQRIELADGGPVPLGMIARGTAIDGISPYVTVRIDGALRASFYATSADWGLYRIVADLPPGVHDVEWAFVNDKPGFPETRDLDVLVLGLGAIPPGWDRYHRWSAPVRLDPARMAHRVLGRAERDGYHLWNRGMLADDVYFDRAGPRLVRMFVSRPAGVRERGLLRLRVDGSLLDERVVGPGPSRQTFLLDLDAGLHRLAWEYRTPSRAAPRRDDLVVGDILVGDSRGKRLPGES